MDYRKTIKSKAVKQIVLEAMLWTADIVELHKLTPEDKRPASKVVREKFEEWIDGRLEMEVKP